MNDTQPIQPAPPPRKRHHWVRNILLGFAAVIVVIVVFAVLGSIPSGGNHTTAAPPASSAPAVPASPVATQPAPSPSPSTFSLAAGQPVTLSDQNGTNGGTVTVTKVIRTTQPNDPSFESGPANGLYVLVEVTYTAAKGQQLDASAIDWYALSATGQHYSYDGGNAMDALASSQMLDSSTINGGESTTGWISFDVPPGHGTIVYAPNYSGPPVASWKY